MEGSEVVSKVSAGIITGFGINADRELEEAFRQVGASASRVHINDLIESPSTIHTYHIIGFPGGFSFGDHIGSGLVFAGLFKRHLKDELDLFVSRGGLIIGICNGFQVLVKMGVLPNLDGSWSPSVSLIHNRQGVFEDSWIRVSFNNECGCVWTRNLRDIDLPIRHGEGRFITASPEISDSLKKENLISVTYEGRNPNGSEDGIAGITDATGRILGLMPHPEAYLFPENHPLWSRGVTGTALDLFQNGISAVRSL